MPLPGYRQDTLLVWYILADYSSKDDLSIDTAFNPCQSALHNTNTPKAAVTFYDSKLYIYKKLSSVVGIFSYLNFFMYC
jgi:hypothetical protein